MKLILLTENVPEMTRKLANLTGLVGAMTSEEVEYSVQVLDKVVWSGNATLTSQSTAYILITYNNMINVEEDILLNLERLHSSTTRLHNG